MVNKETYIEEIIETREQFKDSINAMIYELKEHKWLVRYLVAMFISVIIMNILLWWQLVD